MLSGVEGPFPCDVHEGMSAGAAHPDNAGFGKRGRKPVADFEAHDRALRGRDSRRHAQWLTGKGLSTALDRPASFGTIAPLTAHLDIGVIEHDERRVAAHFERDLLTVPAHCSIRSWSRPSPICLSRNTIAMDALGQTYSITSAAAASSAGGTSNPSDFAVLRFMASSNFVGC